ncbi:AAA family ATPase [Kineococcus rhizosphaerae]|uniref:ATPase family protein associated with various cellular activities (AAA) n=1 Tax=Kineococcus rhizosphaerae TaxID=559628 RepID=A0A2T0RBF8_9ACTN|nr:AAA family ATPase [Kineococcus rhizosphaerae]PRY18504.1 ATPase family protein associated with various cellular activities (AAA) [Kineococcus rhizosphaerae]
MSASEDPLLRSLLAAVEASPDDAPLRLHVAQLLLAAGDHDGALAHASRVLALDPTSTAARELVQQALARPPAAPPSAPAPAFDWASAEADLGPLDTTGLAAHDDEPDPGTTAEVQRPRVTLSDVAGMAEVKERLELAFLGPLRNPELRRLYGKSLRGGLLLYGPPGCGKTFIARAVAGEMGAQFLSVGLSDVLDMWIGNSEKNLHALFEQARRNAPCVLFFDEVDGLGMSRSGNRSSGMRTTVQQFLAELDGVDGDNEGVFVLAATNAPWDVDPALRRPGRLDRMLLVLPPDERARLAVLEHHLRERPTDSLDLAPLAAHTEGFSGADLAHVVETAAELALRDSLRSGRVRPITGQDLHTAWRQVRPSTGPWFEAARNVATYANTDGSWDDLVAHLRTRRR